MTVYVVDQDGADDFTGLFVGHYQQLLRLAVLFLGDVPAAEDVVQEAFIRVHGALRRRRIEDPVAYLRQTVVNLSRSDLRRRLIARKHAPRAMPDAASAEDDAHSALARHEVIAALRSYRWAGARLVLVSKHSRTIRALGAGPQLAKYAGVRCGNLPRYASR
jgi:DNA-directed RNA polymerase specialized sigma24 family protein